MLFCIGLLRINTMAEHRKAKFLNTVYVYVLMLDLANPLYHRYHESGFPCDEKVFPSR